MFRRIASYLVATAMISAVLGLAAWGIYRQWLGRQGKAEEAANKSQPLPPGVTQPVRLSPQARKNLGLVSKPVQPTTYWRTIDIPALIIDRPGVSDRGVVTPITGVVTKILAYPGDAVEPGGELFSVRIVSEPLHTSQLEIFKASREIEISQVQKKRIAELADVGTIARNKIIEIDNQISRLQVLVQAYRQDLLTRGLAQDRIDAAAQGDFVTEIMVHAPGMAQVKPAAAVAEDDSQSPKRLPFSFELQELKVELGQQVQTGQVLCTLADHRALQIEGRGFKEDLPLIQEAARRDWQLAVDFDQLAQNSWPPAPDKLRIHHVASTIDSESRTFAFFLALENQAQAYLREGKTHFLWRFRPGDRVRLRVPVEKLENVLVLPQQALVREGPEAYVFRQNGDLFDRRPVHVLHEDRLNVVLANDSSIRPGSYIAQESAASLNRVLKAQMASGQPTNLHVHADGTVHAAH
ncbi:MAG: HlyD family efflux transporter periplasmic adaptor subunit [Planctomycetales bacterium]|nr:HlyD family efflux transporter periplasmic adaptor subunit [Planctomycetales bacterium]